MKKKNAPNRYFRVRKSAVAGRGGFAIRKIRKGTRIAEYTGERIDDKEADRRYVDDDDGSHHTFLFSVGKNKNVDGGVNGSDTSYINHSCDPNCEAVIEKGRIFIEAIRTIYPGEELFYDYQYERDNTSDKEARKLYPCFCGADDCRGTIMAPRKKKRARKGVKKGAKKGARKADR